MASPPLPDEQHLRKRPPKINTKIIREEETATNATKRDGEPVSPAGRLFHEPNFNCHIISILGSGTLINVEIFIEGIRATLARHPRFSSIPVRSYIYIFLYIYVYAFISYLRSGIG
jgi:hypothetical protein